MNDALQWGITTIVLILGIIAGRAWERYDRKVAKDKTVLEKFQELLPSSLYLEIREFDFAGTFPLYILEKLELFSYRSNDPEFFFIDKELERIRARFVEISNEFLNLLAAESSPVSTGLPWQKIPQPHEYSDPHRFEELQKELNSLADNFCDSYELLIKTAKRKL
jgi:hypothetical protein